MHRPHHEVEYWLLIGVSALLVPGSRLPRHRILEGLLNKMLAMIPVNLLRIVRADTLPLGPQYPYITARVQAHVISSGIDAPKVGRSF